MKAVFDTNVLVYLFDASARGKQAIARKLLAERGNAGEIVLSTQVPLGAGASVLYSEDLQGGRRYDALEVVNPFAG